MSSRIRVSDSCAGGVWADSPAPVSASAAVSIQVDRFHVITFIL
jgi:hypothetical protein